MAQSHLCETGTQLSGLIDRFWAFRNCQHAAQRDRLHIIINIIIIVNTIVIIIISVMQAQYGAGV